MTKAIQAAPRGVGAATVMPVGMRLPCSAEMEVMGTAAAACAERARRVCG